MQGTSPKTWLQRGFLSAVVLGGLSAAPLVSAEEASAAEDETVRKNEAGVPQVEPYVRFLRDGDSAYLAREFDTAGRHYSSAIQEKPRAALAHFRLGEALRAQGKYDEALEALGNAARFAETLELKSRAVFVMADSFERAKRLPRASEEWGVYLKIAESHASKLSKKAAGVREDDPIYAESAKERLKQIKAAIERAEAYQAVKERIQKRQEEVEKKTRATERKKKAAAKVPTSDISK